MGEGEQLSTPHPVCQRLLSKLSLLRGARLESSYGKADSKALSKEVKAEVAKRCCTYPSNL